MTKFQEVGLNKTNKIDQDKPEFYRLRSEKEVEQQAQQRQDRFDTRQNQGQIETLSASPKPNTSRLEISKNISKLETILDSKSKMSQNGDTNLAEAINNLGDGFKDLSDTLKNAEKNRLKPAAYPFQKYSGREDPRSIDELQRQIGYLADMSEWDEAQVIKNFPSFLVTGSEAYEAFLSLPNEDKQYLLPDPNDPNRRSLFIAFRKKLEDNTTAKKARVNYGNLKQMPEESLFRYSNRVRSIVNKGWKDLVKDETILEKLVIERVIEGLRSPRLKECLQRKNLEKEFDSLSTLQDEAKNQLAIINDSVDPEETKLQRDISEIKGLTKKLAAEREESKVNVIRPHPTGRLVIPGEVDLNQTNQNINNANTQNQQLIQVQQLGQDEQNNGQNFGINSNNSRFQSNIGMPYGNNFQEFQTRNNDYPDYNNFNQNNGDSNWSFDQRQNGMQQLWSFVSGLFGRNGRGRGRQNFDFRQMRLNGNNNFRQNFQNNSGQRYQNLGSRQYHQSVEFPNQNWSGNNQNSSFNQGHSYNNQNRNFRDFSYQNRVNNNFNSNPGNFVRQINKITGVTIKIISGEIIGG